MLILCTVAKCWFTHKHHYVEIYFLHLSSTYHDSVSLTHVLKQIANRFPSNLSLPLWIYQACCVCSSVYLCPLAVCIYIAPICLLSDKQDFFSDFVKLLLALISREIKRSFHLDGKNSPYWPLTINRIYEFTTLAWTSLVFGHLLATNRRLQKVRSHPAKLRFKPTFTEPNFYTQ